MRACSVHRFRSPVGLLCLLVLVRASVDACMCGCVYVWVRVCVSACMCGCVYVWVRECVGVLEREKTVSCSAYHHILVGLTLNDTKAEISQPAILIWVVTLMEKLTLDSRTQVPVLPS